MKADRFTEICREFREKEDALMTVKGGDYATSEDRLWNFHTQGALQGVAPSVIALTHFLKHIVTLDKAIMQGTGEWMWEVNGREGLKQRILDARNYLLFMAACLEEERNVKAE